MSPFYYNIQQQHPYVALAALLLAPLAYVAILAGSFEGTQFSGQRAAVIRLVLCGGILGVLFCVLALGPLVVPFVRTAVSSGVPGPEVIASATLQFTMFTGFVLFHYAVLGAAAGGITGLARDLLIQRPINPNPEP